MIQTELTAPEIEQLARALRDARSAGNAIPPLTEAHPELSVADAYAIAAVNVAERVDAGATVTGQKIGLTAPAVQAQLGVDSPDYGALLDTMAIAEGATADASVLIAPRIELEVAFVLSAPLQGPGVTAADVVAATAHVVPALEIVDSAIADWKITLADTVADAASSAAYVLGDATAVLADLDIANLDAELYRDGELVEPGHTSAVLGDPCASVAWLANALADHGDRLEPGQVILSGACTKMVAVKPGDRFTGRVAGLGEVSVSFAPAAEGTS